ncbi:hypothetical protein [Metabacillus sp. cB07]|uniref:hypothetical protein n=1 Tax=Metabacillus sp. cB07 TaxID=2806989 RepID=UPI00193AADC0|nr:hypothetical protein [Metabacillus sp. cB07]
MKSTEYIKEVMKMGCLSSMMKIPGTILILFLGWMTADGLIKNVSAGAVGYAAACVVFLVVLAGILYMMWGKERHKVRSKVGDYAMLIFTPLFAVMTGYATYAGFKEGEYLIACAAALFCLVAAFMSWAAFITLFDKETEDQGA